MIRVAPLEAEEMCDKINFVVQIGWNRVKKILAPCVGEFCFNPLRPSDTSPKIRRTPVGFWGRQVGRKEIAMTEDSANTHQRLGGFAIASL